MQKRSVFVQNKLSQISKLCEIHPITFTFINGYDNPADCVTRPISYNQLLHTNYLTGPNMSNSKELSSDFLSFVVPNKNFRMGDPVPNTVIDAHAGVVVRNIKCEHLVQPDRYSSFHRLVGVHARMFEFIHNVKRKIEGTGCMAQNTLREVAITDLH